MKTKWMPVAAGLMTISLVAAGCGTKPSTDGQKGADSGSKVKVEFFQNKTEAKATFDKLIQKFNAANPTINVVQVNPPDAETVLKTRVSKNDVPDVVGLGATDTFTALAGTGIFKDFANDPLAKTIQPAYLDMLRKQTGTTQLYGIPFSTNADGVIYNKTLFKDLGLTVPKTWDEFIAVAQKAKDAGKIPFYFTLKDSWTALPSFNALASNLQGDTFMEKRKAGQVTFEQGYKAIAEKQLKLLDYGHKDNFGKTYADGNAAFAKGESVMYLQGIWAIPEIKKANPNADLGVFSLPVSNDPAQTRLVSGVDTLLTISKNSKHPNEAAKFVEFLLQPENSKTYIDEQKAFSAVKGVDQVDPSLSELQPYFQKGALVDFADHSFPAAMKLDKLDQEFLQSKDVNSFLKTLDKEWDKVQSRK